MTTNTNNQNIAREIMNQIGNGAFMMIGAKNFVAIENGLKFKVGRNAKGVNHITITLNASDLYDVTFASLRSTSYKVKASEEGIYFDMLKPSIERNTGMYTSF